MNARLASLRHASAGRIALFGVGGFAALLLAGAIVLWAKLGTVVFFELIAAGIAYCF